MRKVSRDTLCFLCILKHVLRSNFKNVPSWWKHKDKCVTFKEIGSFSVPINAHTRSRPSIILNFSPNVNLMMTLVREKKIYIDLNEICVGVYNIGSKTTAMTFSSIATFYNSYCEEVARKYWGVASGILGSRFSPLNRSIR